MTDKNEWPDESAPAQTYESMIAARRAARKPPKKTVLENALIFVQIALFIVLAYLAIKTIFEPRTVQIIIGEDDVIEAIETTGCR